MLQTSWFSRWQHSADDLIVAVQENVTRVRARLSAKWTDFDKNKPVKVVNLWTHYLEILTTRSKSHLSSMGSVNFWYVKFHRLHILSTCIGKSNNPVYLRTVSNTSAIANLQKNRWRVKRLSRPPSGTLVRRWAIHRVSMY